jgi:NADPH:quinone reductase-like Zn-dependent oxidoreductase
MKAVVYRGKTLRIAEVEKPTPADDQVLIKVRAASVNPLDHGLVNHPVLRRMLLARSKSKVTRSGRDVAGEVEAVGRNVTALKPGDQVFGICGGAFAEYACASEAALAIKPANLSFEQAAAVPLAGLTALQGLRDAGKLQPGQGVLINGAAGGIGTFAVQIANSLGAHVTGVCSTWNVEMVRSLGAERVFDYRREDFTKGGQRYDLIFDLVSNHSLLACKRLLNPKGVFVGAGAIAAESTGRLLAKMLKLLVLARFTSEKFASFMTRVDKEDLNALAGLLEAGKVTPVIDRIYRLTEAPEAVRYLGERHARGKVVIAMSAGTTPSQS